MTVEETAAAHRVMAENIAKASLECGKPYVIMSRSDSTLRGHYPLEPRLLRDVMQEHGLRVDGEILCPFFKEGGRFTIDNVHYVREGDKLVPAGLTEFARDRSFGYRSSDLREYIEEKTGGEFKAGDVTCISLDSLRAMDLDGIQRRLEAVSGFGKIVVNAVDYCDIKIFSIALYRAMAKGRRFMFRTAAGLVKVLGGVSDQPLLTRADMIKDDNGNGGVVVVGSHTQKTTAQLEELLKMPGAEAVEFDSDKVLDGDEAFYAEVGRCVAEEERIIAAGGTAVCYTRRRLLSLENDTKESALLRSVRISDGVQRLVGQLSIAPSFVIAKGGITSSDVGTKALKVRRATVMGQIRPGIPVWQTGEESRFPGMPYVIFPGNVGTVEDLRAAAEILAGKSRA